MKRYRAFALLLALIMCASPALSSCSKLSKKDIEKDVAGQIAESARISGDGVGASFSILDPIKAARSKGTVTVALANEKLGVTLSSDAAYDAEARRAEVKTSFSAGGDTVNARFDMDGAVFTLGVPEFFADTYGIDVTTFFDDLRAGGLLKLIGVDYDAFAEAAKPFVEAFVAAANSSSQTKEAYDKLVADLKARLNECAHTTEKKTLEVGGESVKAFEIAFDLAEGDLSDLLTIVKTDAAPVADNIDKIAAMLPEDALASIGALGGLGITAPALGDAVGALNGAIDALTEALARDGSETSAKLTFVIHPDTAELLSCAFTADVAADGNEIGVDGSLDLGADPANSPKITGNLTLRASESSGVTPAKTDFTLERAETDGAFTARLTVTSDRGGDLRCVIDLAHDKTAKTYELKGAAGRAGDGDDKFAASFSVSGELEYTETTLRATADKVTFVQDAKKLYTADALGLSVSISAGASFDPTPEYKNLAALDFEGLMDMRIELQETLPKLPFIGPRIAKLLKIARPADPGKGAEPYVPDDVVTVYDGFDERYDYNYDGKLDDADRGAWEELYKPFGASFDEDYDYDGDGAANTASDRAEYDRVRASISGEAEQFGPEFLDHYAEFNESYDYDIDGVAGTESDRADYERYFKPFADEFDTARDYDGDGVADTDDYEYYLYVRRK